MIIVLSPSDRNEGLCEESGALLNGNFVVILLFCDFSLDQNVELVDKLSFRSKLIIFAESPHI